MTALTTRVHRVHEGAPAPRATYRLQLTPELTLDDAAALVDYLAALGVSHAYLSPIWPAVPGSEHGYDVVGHDGVRAELGGPEALERLAAALGGRGMGLLLDVVPSHVAAHPLTDAWRDLLEHGRASARAGFFDVDWELGDGRVLLPLLDGDVATAAARARLVPLRRGERFVLSTPAGDLPLAPESIGALLAGAPETEAFPALRDAAARARALPADPGAAGLRARAAHELAQHAAEPDASAAVDAVLRALLRSPARLAAFLDEQRYRLVPWRDVRRNARRFFDIDGLVALRSDDPDVFAATHAELLRWVERGLVQGLRIDHVDGLRDPERYLDALRAAAPTAWILVEKILAAGEELPASWPVEGTTGYEFMARTTALVHDPAGEAPLRAFFQAFTGDDRGWPEVVATTRRDILRRLFAPDLERCARAFARALPAESIALDALREALAETLVAMDVYRTYVRPADGRVRPEDAARIGDAVARAAALRPDLGAPLAELRARLLLERRDAWSAELVERFQTLSPALAAKAVEDTALYVHHPMPALNEVGTDPEAFDASLAAFHAAAARDARERPWSLLALSTHDAKRGADVRARLALLSEIPDAWQDAVAAWSSLAERHKADRLPDRRMEYLIWQTLFGAWPLGAERARRYFEKAAREAKTDTSWRRPDAEYERALQTFVTRVLADRALTDAIERFTRPLIDPGRVLSLAFVLLAATAPGVPDVYAGDELWNPTLVDPDNRRPVDFARRHRMLAELDATDGAGAWERRAEGAPKLFLWSRALRLRRGVPGAFAPGAGYAPLRARGEHAGRVVAFERGSGAERVIAVAPRRVLGLRAGWGDTALELFPGRYRDVLGGGRHEGGPVALEALFARFPVALLASEALAEAAA